VVAVIEDLLIWPPKIKMIMHLHLQLIQQFLLSKIQCHSNQMVILSNLSKN
jgi:hypothetical protein